MTVYRISKVIIASILCITTIGMHAQEYAYLHSAPFKKRQKKAAELVSDCQVILEIGGGQVPISQFITDKKVIVIDPEIKRKEEELTIHIPQKFECWHDEAIFTGQNYAVVILALALDTMPDHGWHKLIDLIDGSAKTVIEYSVTYKHAKRQLKRILKETRKTITQEFEFDFSQLNFRKYPIVHRFRRMVCLE